MTFDETKFHLKSVFYLAFFLTCAPLAAVYLWYHPIYIINVLIAIPLILILIFLVKIPIIRLKIYAASLVWILLIYIFTSFYTIVFYWFRLEQQIAVTDLLYANLEITKLLPKYILTTGVYILASLTLGKPFTGFVQHKEKRLMFRFIVGLIILSELLFVLGILGFLTKELIVIVGVTIIVVNFRSIITEIPKYRKKLARTVTIDIHTFYGVLNVALFFVSAIVFSSLFRGFQEGPDALRDYLNLTKHIATFGQLPTTQTIISRPFLTEVLIAPAFIIGNIPLATSTLYSISIIFILPFYLIAQKVSSGKVKLAEVTIMLITVPSVLNFLLVQYKVDLLLCLVAATLFLSVFQYASTRDTRYIYLTAFLAGASILIKLTALFFVVPLIILILRKDRPILFFKRGLFSSLFFIIPFLPWVILYKVNTVYFGEVGLGLAQIARHETVRITGSGQESSCSLFSYELSEVYKWNKYPNKYLFSPYHYMRGLGQQHKIIYGLDDVGPHLLFLIFSLPFVIKRATRRGKPLHTLLLISIISMIIFFIIIPELIWYILPTILLIYTIFFSIFRKLHQRTYKYTITLLLILIAPSILIIATSMYYPLDQKAIKDFFSKNSSSGNHYETIQNAFEASSFLNEFSKENPTIKYIFTFDYSMVNIQYFLDDYYNKVIYLNSGQSIHPETFQEILQTNNVEYMILNNIVASLENADCLKKEYEAFRNLFEKTGDKVFENTTYTIYKAN